ncbi:hypothetical protein AVEN_151004-1 [Araneus ventricosus]|uniref:Uncharacterized protein n=1 Tax=Araneus ventricosus TaxID=182803 RepID=A0A4Y2PE56_ARAVE|nr:hypothetical protein AVEN_151004-1 [Araneus ventricosus]
MTRTTPELAPLSPYFHATPSGGCLATMYDLACTRPHTRRIFSGIGFRTWNPPSPKPRPYHLATAALKLIKAASLFSIITLPSSHSINQLKFSENGSKYSRNLEKYFLCNKT